MPSGPASSMRVAIVGASSLRGKELKHVLEDRNFPASEIILLDDTVMAGTLTEAAGEATFIRALEEDSFEGARFAFFAGTAGDTERNWQTAQRAGATVIDLTGALAQLANAVSWIPALDAHFSPQGSRANAYSSPSTPVLAACFLAAAAKEFAPRRIVILFFPPVSEHDQLGIEELESQTANLLSFRPIAQEVFDAQVAFNLLASYGPGSKKSLASHRASISKGVESYLAGRCLAPAIQVVQAPVFYGYSFAAYMDFDPPVASGQLESALVNLGVRVAAPEDPAPSNITTAGENQIHLARISADPAVPSGIWIWGVADNLRLAAVNAVQIAEKLIAH
jgi:aspartate-semialdehyde dehydrogenase